ncbi:MAG: methyltransferase [Bacteroidales bacterium]|nr:methyltransferase [Bacteroidales bacterium]
MPNPYFRFKQFTILQDKCAMKVGTDGVLLGAWVATGDARRILDIGTGTGLIALMLAQRSGADIHAVEIDPGAAEQAGENFRNSPWAVRLKILRQDFLEFVHHAEPYDLIVSNPPYFRNSLKAPDPSRATARHDHQLDLDGLLSGAASLLNPNGRVGLVYPAAEMQRVEEVAASYGLFLSGKTEIIPAPGKAPKRVLFEFDTNDHQGECNTNYLVLEETGRHRYSEAYKILTQDFYL